MLITIFARKEPTVDQVALNHGVKDKNDVVFYKDEACTQFYCRWSWFNSPPRTNRKTVTLNCYNWALKWLPAVPHPKTASVAA